MNQRMPVIVSGKILQRVFVCDQCLFNGGISDGVHGNLQPGAVGVLDKGIDLRLRVEQHAPIV